MWRNLWHNFWRTPCTIFFEKISTEIRLEGFKILSEMPPGFPLGNSPSIHLGIPARIREKYRPRIRSEIFFRNFCRHISRDSVENFCREKKTSEILPGVFHKISKNFLKTFSQEFFYGFCQQLSQVFIRKLFCGIAMGIFHKFHYAFLEKFLRVFF